MPELPEVETIRRDLAAAVAGATIVAVRLHHADLLLDGGPVAPFTRKLAGRRIEALERRGKNLAFRLAPGGDVLQTQVRMTGRFAVASADDPGGANLREEIGFSHVAAEFSLADGRTLLYDDVRRLGGFRLQSADEWKVRESELGPEPLAEGYRAADLAAGLGGGRAPVKNALLDQRRVAGIGNIYASEALFRARIDPRKRSGDLTAAEHRRLHRALRVVLREALAGEGTSLRDYQAVNGRSGQFQERLRAYAREGEPCPRCGEAIERIVQAGRSTFFCPACQA
ncbi:MAG: bifunctional DNA-formamidopyrimidine glycosylase/DNA-(apurinic or apyrimidinic site) lyase [Gemmatimonadales bacterium]|jgi:formamidopyrimidine-DNA glycosylase